MAFAVSGRQERLGPAMKERYQLTANIVLHHKRRLARLVRSVTREQIGEQSDLVRLVGLASREQSRRERGRSRGMESIP